MKKFVVVFLLLPLFFGGISNVFAQGDIVTVQPVHSTSDPCAFNLTISNHNTQGKSIDEVIIALSSQNIQITGFTPPAQWSQSIDGNSDSAYATADNSNALIAPNATMSNFIFSWTGDQSQYDNPYTVTWITLNGGNVLSTGTIMPICTQFQSFDKIDTVLQPITSQSAGDPCFNFTMRNQNHQGGTFGSTIDIYNVSFQLENTNGGTMRPSKITPAQNWILDSVTTYTAYFHTDVNPILAGTSLGGWSVCLRANTQVNKFNIVWTASDAADAFIDRDTLFNVSNTATSSATEADSMSVKPVSGCLYNVTLKNFHLANNLAPSRIVKLILRSKTSGIAFKTAPSYPLHWLKPQVTSDSIVFTADSLFDGIPDGIVSANQFSFSVDGPTTTNFDIGWETYHSSNPFPPKVALLSTGTVTTKCTVAPPSADLAVNGPGLNTCDYKLTVTNAHNPGQSNLNALSISIPANSGQLLGTAGPAGWAWGSAGASISCKSPSSSDNMVSGSSQDFLYTFAPKTPGTNVTATWTTTDDQNATTGTGTFVINCSPIVNVCDTLVDMASVNDDSCIKTLNFTNRKSVAITQLIISTTNGWRIVTASAPTGWTALNVGLNQVNYTATDGLAAGAQQSFQLQFANYYPDTMKVPPPNNFFVDWVSTDINGASCNDSLSVTPGCLARSFHVDTTNTSVPLHSGDIGVANFTIVPNPTRGSADISFDLNSSERVVITVLDVLGHQITTLNSKIMSQGTYNIPYEMSGLPDGTYYIRMQTPLGVMTRKLVLTK